MQDLSFLENCLLVCLLLIHTEVFPVLIYFYVLAALWLPMLEQIFYFLTFEMLELSVPELFHSVVTESIIYSHFEMLDIKTFESLANKQVCYERKGLKAAAKDQCLWTVLKQLFLLLIELTYVLPCIWAGVFGFRLAYA